MRIGFIGLGNMGVGHGRKPDQGGPRGHRLQPVAGQGRRAGRARARSLRGPVAEACGGDVVITMLANDDAVEA